MSFRLYITRATRTRVFLCTVKVPSVTEAVLACGAYRARLRAGDRFYVKAIGGATV